MHDHLLNKHERPWTNGRFAYAQDSWPSIRSGLCGWGWTGALLLALCASVVACAGQATKKPAAPGKLTELWVKAHLVPCKGWAGQNYCFSVAGAPEGPWLLAYDGLQNFYYQWGFSYRLLVSTTALDKEDVKDLIAGGVKVVKITKKTRAPIGTEFEFTVDPQLKQLGMRNHLTMDKGVGQILMGPAFTCPTISLCDDIERRLRSDQRFVVTFVFGVDGVRATRVRTWGATAKTTSDTTVEAVAAPRTVTSTSTRSKPTPAAAASEPTAPAVPTVASSTITVPTSTAAAPMK